MAIFKSAIFAAFFVALGSLPVFGQETLVLKDGSSLFGQRAKDDYKENTMTFRIDSARMVIPITDLNDEKPRLIPLSTVPESWRRWFKNHPEKIVYRNNDKYVWLGSVNYSDDARKFYKDYVIIEEVDDSIARIFTTSIGEIRVSKNKEVDHIEISSRDPLALVGTVNEIETINGSIIRGQIVEDRAKAMVILTDDGVRHIIPYKDIRVSRILPFNSNRPLSEQVSNNYRLEGGHDDGVSVIGIITETVYKSRNGEGGYYMVADSEGLNKSKYLFSQVDRITRIPNSRFVKEKDVKVDDNQLLIQLKEACPVEYEIKSDRYEIADTAKAVRIKASDLDKGIIKIHFKESPSNTDFIFVEAKESPNLVSKKKIGQVKDTEPGQFYASLNDMIINSYTASERFVSPAGNVSLTYGPIVAGKAYLLIRKSDPAKTAYLIIVEP